ncbi:MAG: nucleoside triphosphate pyrophosphohydrolase [Deltaproteobacteria bacterium]|nr:nucleoside triphosphate pyrophosphohydrolase [Deltaproteobacteria bacterium]
MTDQKYKEELAGSFIELVALAAKLRSPEGCPWDRKQTIDTVRMYLLEECYEAMDAIEKKDYQEMCYELGDLLFMIVFLAQLSREQALFNMADVINNIIKKMKNRHPHVFGDAHVNSAEEVSENWQKIKMQEMGGNKSASSILEDVPVCLPALLRAHRLSKKASKAGFDWKNKNDIWDKVNEEFNELTEAVHKGSKDDVKEEIGDLFFSLVNLARHWNLNSEELLRDANIKFVARFGMMEKELNESGIKLDNATYEDMNNAWDRIKKNTGQ